MDAAIHSPVLVNAVGHLAGIVAFGAFLVLLDRRARLSRRTRLSAPTAAAALAFLWNLGSLVVLIWDTDSNGQEIVASLSFAVLSMLPCVLLHLALRAQYRWLRAAGYLTGAISAGLHLLGAFGFANGFHKLAIQLTTNAFAGFAVVFVVLLLRGQADRRSAAMRASVAISLFLIAASFVHFEDDPGAASWARELLFHHAAIPLALFVLLHEYRFLLLDAFVRLFGVVALAGLFPAALLGALVHFGWLDVGVAGSAGLAGIGVAMTLSILLYPPTRNRIGNWIEPVFFRRGDIETALRRMSSLGNSSGAPVIERISRLIGDFISAQRWSLAETEELDLEFRVEALDERTSVRRPSAVSWAEVAVALPVSPGRSRVLWLGPRVGGRRYLSADLDDLDRLRSEAVGRLDSLRRDEQQRMLAEAELQALRAQINPHFLFNALNALYGVIPRAAPGARQTLLNLAEILRYSLDSKRQYVPLEEELRVVEAYLAIERLRLQERLSVSVECDDAARTAMIPAFTIQPLVENAVKHGISGSLRGGNILVTVRTRGGHLSIEVVDDGVGFDADSPPKSGHGLYNVQRRLELCYGDSANFKIESSGAMTRASFSVPASTGQLPPVVAEREISGSGSV